MPKRTDILLEQLRDGHDISLQERIELTMRLSWPAILAQLSLVLMFFIDAAMVGHLGANESAAIGLTETTMWLMGGLGTAFVTGFSVQVAHAIGANKEELARNILSQSLLFVTFVSLCLGGIAVGISADLPRWLRAPQEIWHDASYYFFFYGLAYPIFTLMQLASAMLRCAGNIRFPSIVSIVICLLDVLFNAFFIFGLKCGVAGAAYGTFLSVIVGASILMYYLYFRSDQLSLHHRHGSFWPTLHSLRNAMKITLPMIGERVILCGAQLTSTIIVAPLGAVAIAANSLAITAESLCYMPGFGIADAATTLVGQSFGAKRHDMCRSYSRISVSMGMGIMTVMGIVMYVFAPQLMHIMTNVPQVVSEGTHVLRIEAFAEPLFAAYIVGYGVFVGLGQTLVPTIMNLVCIWGIRVLGAWWLVAQGYGLAGAWIAMAVELSVRGAMYLIKLGFEHRKMAIKILKH